MQAGEDGADDVRNSVACPIYQSEIELLPEVRPTNDNPECAHAAKSKRKLKHRNESTAAIPKAVIHNVDVRGPAAELGITHNEADSPVRDTTKNYQEDDASKESCSAQSVWKP